MINLLPPAAQKHLAWEYRLRFLAVLMLIVAVVILLLLVLSLPLWLMQKHQLKNMTSGDGQLLTELAAEQQEADRDAKTAAAIIEHFSNEERGDRFSDIIKKIDELAGEDITITNFEIDDKKKMTINGVAAVRTALSAFRDRLEEDKQFSGVTLPLSSLVDENDVDFTITLSIKK